MFEEFPMSMFIKVCQS